MPATYAMPPPQPMTIKATCKPRKGKYKRRMVKYLNYEVKAGGANTALVCTHPLPYRPWCGGTSRRRIV